MNRFSGRLKELRIQHGMTQGELAMRIGVSKSSVNMYERGEREPGLETIGAIADCFRVNVDSLLGRETEPAAGSAQGDSRLERIEKIIRDIDEGKSPGYGFVVGFGSKGEAIREISDEKYRKIQQILALIDGEKSEKK